MKVRALVLILMAVLASARPAASAVTGAGGSGPDAVGTWIVVLADRSDVAGAALALAGRVGGEVSQVYDHVLGGFAFRGSAAAADALARSPEVRSVEPDRPVHLTEAVPFGVLRIGGWSAHQAGYAGTTSIGTKVRIAIVDSGINAAHSDLAPNVATAEGKNCVGNQPPNDDNGHGTHVAGTAAAAYNGGDGVVGVATDARLTAIKVVGADGNGTDAQVLCGVNHAVGLATSTGVPTVINLSLGEARTEGTGCGSSALHQAICDATAAGVTVVAAAGNDASDAATFYPAAFPEVVAVSAFTDFDGGRTTGSPFCAWEDTAGYECDEMLADFSNYGSVVDVTAPGVRIYSTDVGGGWSVKSGTSMASPHVAGVAALILGAHPGLAPADVRRTLMATGECPDGAQADSSGSCAGHGGWQVGSLFGIYPDPDGIAEPLVNALRAAQASGSGGGGTPPPPPSTVHLSSLTASAAAGRKSWTAGATAGVANQAGTPVSGATVAFALSGGANGSLSCTTSSAGTCSVSTSVPSRKTSVTFTVTGVTVSGATYDAVQNTAPSAVTATKP